MRLGVLILGQSVDPHIQRVRTHLEASGAEVRIFDQYRDQAAFLSGGGDLVPGFHAWLQALDCGAVWSRVKLPFPPVREEFRDLFPAPDSPVGIYQTRMHWRSEWRVFNRSLLRTVIRRYPHIALVNRGVLLEDADCKPVQLQAAIGAGFQIPRTVIGNDEAALDATFEADILYKPLSTSPVGGTGVPMPAMLRKPDILAHGMATVAPAIYQNRVAKSHELRVNVAGGRIHTIAIESQTLNRSLLDWRTAQNKREIYRKAEISPDVEQAVHRYMAEMKLDIAALDFANTPDGQCVFFECNPGGQWIWLEDFVGSPISADIAQAILDRAKGRPARSEPNRLLASEHA